MKRWAAAVLMLAIIMTALCAAALADVQWATVNNPDPADRLNLRAKPSTDAISYGKYYNGTQVQILSGPKNGWFRVRVGTGNGVCEIDGYMMARYLATGERAEQVPDARPTVRIVAPDGDAVRIKDFVSGSNVGKVQDGETVTVLGVGITSLHILGSDGDVGMLPADLATPRLFFSEQNP